MAKNEEEKPKGGCLGKLFSLLVFVSIIGLGSALFFVSQAQDLSDLGSERARRRHPGQPSPGHGGRAEEID